MKRILFENDNKSITENDFVKALKSIGIKLGDTIFVHSDIAVFGKLILHDRQLLLNSFLDILKKAVGPDGTIIMPTFSYSFCDDQIFNKEKTPSSVGILTEFFRTQEGVKRTIHPIFSIGVLGKKKDDYLRISHDSFDRDSIFGLLHRHKAKIVFLGASFQSCTFMHYVEQIHGVPYRYIKKFKGTIVEGGKQFEDEYTFFVRYLNKNVIFDTTKLANHLKKMKLLKETKIGNGSIMSIETSRLFNEGQKMLSKNIYFFLKETPNE